MEVVASAPGKVLIAGGYLVLERPNAGLVLSTTARFYAVVRPLRDSLPADSWTWAWTDVKVTSPQLSRVATYKLSLNKTTLQLTSSRESTNPFVEQAIQFSVAAAKATIIDKERKDVVDKLLLQGLNITIIGHNDFYSYRKQIEARGLPLTPEVLLSLPPFSSITFNSEVANGTMTGEKCKPEVAKTGLGSSAAMTTSVVAALLHYLGAVNLSCSGQSSGDNASGRELDLVHAIAQSAHCLAQGKIGSGFDVSAAVYGSQRYVRFSPEILSSAQAIGGTVLPDVVSDVLTQRWDHENKQFSLPPLMTLLLGEPGTGGSSTPSMVGSVKRWLKSDPEKSRDTWSKLAIANSTLENQLRILKGLSENHHEAYESMWAEVATNQHQELIIRSLLAARDACLEIRLHMREMGIAAGVPIEPDSQTRLLDATMNMEGVLLAGVPGAGGFDAVFSVVLGDASNAVAHAWSSVGVLPLPVREDCRGVSLEDADPRTREVSAAVWSIQIN
ncbi:phosphomevalonate kinase isoform X2 [Zea mays]|uniref:phosphomevalonate kinase n=1 Tax=Zea mays TaxID=4577 RepID=K7VNG3_MAIZE|nr:phosphomevalonate kinase isoform X2 [Zea mays]AQL08004.1 Phosphomevalonate kinase [Zea mays]|eukprot:XP_008658635.1 phosphomevalonate kinase isoform X2 [Zea mays]